MDIFEESSTIMENSKSKFTFDNAQGNNHSSYSGFRNQMNSNNQSSHTSYNQNENQQMYELSMDVSQFENSTMAEANNNKFSPQKNNFVNHQNFFSSYNNQFDMYGEKRPASDPLPASFLHYKSNIRPQTMKGLFQQAQNDISDGYSQGQEYIDLYSTNDSYADKEYDYYDDNYWEERRRNSYPESVPRHSLVPSQMVPLSSPKKSSSTLSLVYKVRFKRSTSTFRLAESCPTQISIGDYVKVEADRGHDIGVVCGVLPTNPNLGEETDRLILNLASHDEKIFLLSKLRDENRALAICKEMASKRSMQIQLLDAEFQFDRNKLTFVFTSKKRTDFRELVRDLFAFFKTRIWMQKINPSHVTAFQQSLYPFPGLLASEEDDESQLKQQYSPTSNPPPPPPASPSKQQHQQQSYQQFQQQQVQVARPPIPTVNFKNGKVPFGSNYTKNGAFENDFNHWQLSVGEDQSYLSNNIDARTGRPYGQRFDQFFGKN